MKDVNASEFKELINRNIVTIVDFAAMAWCRPCQAMVPILEQMSDEIKDLAEIVKIEIDVEENKDILAQYNVRSVPTFIFFKDGEEVKRVNGMMTKKQIIDAVTVLTDDEF